MYPEVEDATLTQAIERIRRVLPYSGIIAVQTELVNQGLRVTRDRVAAALRAADPETAASRWQAAITRRTYWVAAPFSLWHLDGMHCCLTTCVCHM